MIYVKIDPKGTRLGNWMFQFAAAKTARPDEPVTFVIEDERDWAAVRKYGCLWGDVAYACAAPAGAEVRTGLFQDEKFVDRGLAQGLFLERLKNEVDTRNGMDDPGNGAFGRNTKTGTRAGGQARPNGVRSFPLTSRLDSSVTGYDGSDDSARAERPNAIRPAGLGACPRHETLRDTKKHENVVERLNDNLVSIHVRRGDYLRLPHRHPFVGEAYLKAAVAKFPGARFLVFSDDIAWCRRFFVESNFPALNAHGHKSKLGVEVEERNCSYSDKVSKLEVEGGESKLGVEVEERNCSSFDKESKLRGEGEESKLEVEERNLSSSEKVETATTTHSSLLTTHSNLNLQPQPREENTTLRLRLPTSTKSPRFSFAEGNGVLDDLYLMTQCRGGHICSNSTFSWWGAFLGEGKTVFPSMWYGCAMKGAEWRGMYFRGSEIVENHYSLGLYLKAQLCVLKTKLGDWLRKAGLR